MRRTVSVQLVRVHTSEIDIVAFLEGTVKGSLVRMPLACGKGVVTVFSELLREGGMRFGNLHSVCLNIV